MKPLSEDLRERVVEAYEPREVPYHKVAKQLRVSVSSAVRYVHQWREKGTVSPKPPANGSHPIIDESGIEFIIGLIKAKPDLSQYEIRERLIVEKGLQVSQPTICRTLKRANITFKKKRKKPKSSKEKM